MLRTSSHRGQTEPIGALFAIAFLIIAIGVYGIYVSDVLTDETDRTVEESTMEELREEIQEDGVFRAHDHDALEPLIEPAWLPYGQNVYIEVRTVKDGNETVVANGYFDTEGEPARSEFAADLDGMPEEAGVQERPIPVAVDPGLVRGGTVLVGVW